MKKRGLGRGLNELLGNSPAVTGSSVKGSLNLSDISVGPYQPRKFMDDDALREFGLSISQFALLATLKFDGNSSLTDIADSLGLDRTTLSRNLKPLERRGLISIKLAEDKRKRLLFLSKPGNELLESALPKWREVQNQTIIALGPEKQEALITDLNLSINIKS